jgi:CRISPR-associated protein Csd1
MSWMQRLYQTYEEGMKLDIAEDLKPMPVSHTVQNAHINIVVDGNGNFRRAKVLEKTQIVLPATEKSAGRSSGEAAHALADKLQYVAGDYKEFGGEKPNYFEGYKKQLAEWCNSEHSHPSAKAILDYIAKASVIKDLFDQKIAWLDNQNILLKAWPEANGDAPLLFKVLPKDQGMLDQGNALICWTVEDNQVECPDTWKDTCLQQKWIDYDNSKTGKTGLCYISGDTQPLASSHPAKLRHSGDKAKLISSNDLSGFTFRGRFTDSEPSIKDRGLQPASVGVVTTQKAHNALRWLIGRPKQAFRNGDQAIVAWATSGKEIPRLLAATTEFDLDDFDEIEEAAERVDSESIDKVIDHSKDLGQRFAAKLNAYISGYRATLSDTVQISIMAIDSATPGRMAITYYRETLPQEYLQRITQWHTDFAWPQRVMTEVPQTKGKLRSVVTWPVSSPSPFSILQVVYGDTLKSNDSLKKNFYERIVPCILEGREIPEDFLRLSVARASNPAGQDHWEWERALGVACSLYRGFHLRHPKLELRKEFTMALDTTNTSRDYLYGRLLALAERLEDVALYAAGVSRPTTANRLMQRFANRPYETWLTIYKQLEPYMRQMKSARPGFLNNINREIDAVMDLFKHDEFISPAALTGEFLLGFHNQRLALNKKSETTVSIQSETTEEQGA